MAMVRNRGMANVVEGDRALMWSIPDEWSLEEAATVPVAYGTVYYAMVRNKAIWKYMNFFRDHSHRSYAHTVSPE
jgi:NADPH:quinone reductase-like Zn-dependent oxidoreductase